MTYGELMKLLDELKAYPNIWDSVIWVSGSDEYGPLTDQINIETIYSSRGDPSTIIRLEVGKI